MIRHIVMTRFNLPTPGREAAFRGRPGWLEERIALFERLCLPGMAMQHCQDFDWCVFFDEATPAALRCRIASLAEVRAFTPIYTGLFDGGGWAAALRAHGIGPAQPGRWLMTSNLDNDDALASDYTARLRAAAQSVLAGGGNPGRFALNVPEGLVLSGGRLYCHRHAHNAFTTLVEPDDAQFATTMTIRHMELFDHVPVIQVPGAAGWLQVVHGGNVSNRIRGRLTSAQDMATRFPPALAAQAAAPSRSALLADHWLRFPLRSLRDRAFALLRRIIPVDRSPG